MSSEINIVDYTNEEETSHATDSILSDAIHINERNGSNATFINMKAFDDNSSSESDEPPKDIIDEVYTSMHSLMKVLTTDNLMRDSQIQVIKNEIDNLCETYSKTKMELYQMISNNTADITSALEAINNNDNTLDVTSITQRLDRLERELSSIHARKNSTIDNNDLRKQIMNNRTMLLKTLQANIKSIRQELNLTRLQVPDISTVLEKTVKDINTVVEKAVSEEMDKLPSMEEKFDKLAQEQRSTLSRHIRKSTMQNSMSMSGGLPEILGEINKMKQHIAVLEKDLSGVKKELSNVAHELNEITQENTTMRDKLKELDMTTNYLWDKENQEFQNLP